jgi:hypothetical protein
MNEIEFVVSPTVTVTELVYKLGCPVVRTIKEPLLPGRRVEVEKVRLVKSATEPVERTTQQGDVTRIEHLPEDALYKLPANQVKHLRRGGL